jgi:hypothetical protein
MAGVLAEALSVESSGIVTGGRGVRGSTDSMFDL